MPRSPAIGISFHKLCWKQTLEGSRDSVNSEPLIPVSLVELLVKLIAQLPVIGMNCAM
jgi:hypothetical protein